MNRVNMNYSKRGQYLANTFCKTANSANYAKTANKVLWDGFDSIRESPDTTEDEKALAKLGSKIGSHSLDIQEHNRLAFPIMKSISHPVEGPVGVVLAKVALEAADNTRKATSANKAIWEGYNAIIANPKTTKEEKDVARLGNEIASHSLDIQEHNRLGFPVIRAISNSISGPIGTVLAKVALDAADNTDKATSANKAIWEGYNAIVANPDTTEDEKAVARLGNAIAGHSLDIQEHNRLGFPIIRALSGTISGPIGHVLAKVSYDAANNTKYAKSANQALWEGFEAIAKNPNSTDLEKTLAQEGIDFSHQYMDVQEHNRIGFKVMKSIINAGNSDA